MATRSANQLAGRRNALDSFMQSRNDALAYATTRGLGATRAVMDRAARELNKRLEGAIGRTGEDSFTVVQIRTALAQVKAVVQNLEAQLGRNVEEATKQVAQQASGAAVQYIQQADRQFTGVGKRLGIREGALFDRAVRGAESTVLNRLHDDPARGPGIMTRYGEAVIESFEQTLQQRFIQGTPWDEVRRQLTDASPFLQGQPLFWSERIVRTEVMNAHGAATHATIAGAAAMGGTEMLKILCATFDNRTSADSYAVHGQIRRPAEPFNDWTHAYMHPPNRPNDREIVVPHNMAWPIPEELKPKTDAEVAARWRQEGRKGSPPPRPKMTTVPLALIGKPPAPANEERPITLVAPPKRAPITPEMKPPPQKPVPVKRAKKLSHKERTPERTEFAAEALPPPKEEPSPAARARVAAAQKQLAEARARLASVEAAKLGLKAAEANLEAATAKKKALLEKKTSQTAAVAAKKAAVAKEEAAKQAKLAHQESVKAAKQATAQAVKRAKEEAVAKQIAQSPAWTPLPDGSWQGKGFGVSTQLRKGDDKKWALVIDGAEHALPKKPTFDHAEKILANRAKRE